MLVWLKLLFLSWMRLITEFASEHKFAHSSFIYVFVELHLCVHFQQWHLDNRRTNLGLAQVQLVSMDMVPEALQVFRFTLPKIQPGNQGRTATQGHVQQ